MRNPDILIVVEGGRVAEVWKSKFARDCNVLCEVLDMDTTDGDSEKAANDIYSQLTKIMTTAKEIES